MSAPSALGTLPEVKALPLHYLRAGGGQPLLLLHSLGGDSAIWSPLLGLLTPQCEVIAVDMPGFGRSGPLPSDLDPSPRNLARAVTTFLDELGVGSSPHVAGISLGGWVAIECARLGRARSVTALCTVGFRPRAVAPRPNLARLAGRALGPLTPAMMRAGLGRRLALSRHMRHPERLSASEASSLIRAYGRSTGYRRTNELMRASTVGELSELDVPITLAWGDHDRLGGRAPLDGVPPSVRQVVLPDCGHLPTWDAPELVARLILETAAAA
jgi:pimeloyl-ACP methyl ester carboxylesterase